MRFWEGIELAMQQLATEKLKSFFSLLGVIIGVLFLVLVVSVVEGTDRYIKEDVASEVFGVNTVTLTRWPRANLNFDLNVWRERLRRPRPTSDDAEAIRRQLRIPARVVVESRDDGVEISSDNGRTAANVEVLGASDEVFLMRDWVAERGRVFSAEEAARGLPVIVLGFDAADVLFEEQDPIGRSVRIRGFPYRVIGVLEEQGSLFGESLDAMAVAPIESPVKSLVAPRGDVDAVVVQVIDPSQLSAAIVEIEGIMRVRHGLRPREENDFALETADAAVSFWESITQILFLALPAIVGVALVVGGIVIMNIMLVSVMERTREIGVRKAVGARRRDVMVQIIAEATTLSTVGAAVGVAVGLALTGLIRAVSPIDTSVGPAWLAVGVLLGAGVGITAGVYPASRASRLDPVDALRHE